MPKREKIISCIGSAFVPPIYNLYEKLTSTNFSGGENRIQKSMIENGYSCSIIILTVLMIESLINRVKYFSHSKYKRSNGYTFFENKFKNSQLSQKLKEIYQVRNAIAHNHFWSTTFEYDKDFNFTRDYTRRIIKSMEKPRDINGTVNLKLRETKVLKINIIPLRIGLRDTRVVLKTASEVLLFLEQKTKMVNISGIPFQYKNEYPSFSEFVEKEVEPYIKRL